MSNISIQSQENSSLYNSAKQGAGTPMGQIEEFVYDMDAPQVNAFRSRENKTQLLGCAMAGTFQAEIPSFGLWRECYLKFNVSWVNGTNALTPTIADALGANIISSARIMSNSRTIYELTSAEIQYLIYTDKDAGRREGRKKAMKNMVQDHFTGAVANTEGGVTVPLKMDALKAVVDVAGVAGHDYLASNAHVLRCHDVYCPLPFSCFQDKKSNIDTSFTEKLVLEIKTNEHWYAVSGGASGTDANNDLATIFTINKAEVCNEFLVMEQDAKKAIQAKNYSLGGSPLAILGSDFKNKSVQVTADSAKTTASLNLFFTELCHGILFEVQPVRTQATMEAITDQFVGVAETATTNKALQPFTRALASSGQSKPGRFIHANKITIRAGGKLIYEGSHDEIRNLNGSSPMCLNVNGDVETAHEEDVVYASPYNLYYVNFANSHMTTAIKGALALRNLNSIVCEVEFPSVSGTKYNVTAHLRHYVARSIDGGSGSISAALSN